ncbi:MAG: hypothetical protein ACR2NM_04255 [Bythopirellula sp.]
MKPNQQSRSRSSHLDQNEIELRRLISAAVAQHRNPQIVDELPLTPGSQLQAKILPVDEQGSTGPSFQIEVSDFDERGITFHHPQPLHGRRALVVLEGLKLGRIAAEVDLSWCRFTRRGQYTSGGRFVALVDKTA